MKKYNEKYLIYPALIILIPTIIYRMLNPESGINIIEQKRFNIDGDRYANDIEEKGKLSEITRIFYNECGKEKECLKIKMFDYVKEIPYQSEHEKRKPLEVIKNNGGDCDEKSFLYASMLKEEDIGGILIFTNNHAFIGIELKEQKEKKTAAVNIENKKYYFAETTNPNAYIGQDNNITKKDIIAVYDITKIKKIPLEKIEVIKKQS